MGCFKVYCINCDSHYCLQWFLYMPQKWVDVCIEFLEDARAHYCGLAELISLLRNNGDISRVLEAYQANGWCQFKHDFGIK